MRKCQLAEPLPRAVLPWMSRPDPQTHHGLPWPFRWCPAWGRPHRGRRACFRPSLPPGDLLRCRWGEMGRWSDPTEQIRSHRADQIPQNRPGPTEQIRSHRADHVPQNRSDPTEQTMSHRADQVPQSRPGPTKQTRSHRADQIPQSRPDPTEQTRSHGADQIPQSRPGRTEQTRSHRADQVPQSRPDSTEQTRSHRADQVPQSRPDPTEQTRSHRADQIPQSRHRFNRADTDSTEQTQIPYTHQMLSCIFFTSITVLLNNKNIQLKNLMEVYCVVQGNHLKGLGLHWKCSVCSESVQYILKWFSGDWQCSVCIMHWKCSACLS